MKENDSFSMCHPLLNFFYFAVALLFTMFNQHPVFLGISYAGAFVYGGLLNGWRKTLKQGLLLTLKRMGKDSETKLSSYSARSSHCGTIKSHV